MEIYGPLLWALVASGKSIGLGLSLLWVLNRKRIWQLNICWRIMLVVALCEAVFVGAGDLDGAIIPFTDLFISFIWCKEWEKLSGTTTQ